MMHQLHLLLLQSILHDCVTGCACHSSVRPARKEVQKECAKGNLAATGIAELLCVMVCLLLLSLPCTGCAVDVGCHLHHRDDVHAANRPEQDQPTHCSAAATVQLDRGGT
jgi:hypothetical protein